MPTRTLRRAPTALLWACTLVVTGCLAGFGRNTLASLPGTTYRVANATHVSGDTALTAALAGLRSEWTADVIVAGGRGRLDVTHGEAPGLTIGDYVLFDATGFIVVHPAKNESVIALPDAQSLNATLEAAGMRTVIDSVTSSVDSAGSDVVNGRKTTLWQTRLSYRTITEFVNVPSDVDLPAMRATTTMTNRYWFGEPEASNVAVPIFGMAIVSSPFAKMMSSLVGPLAAAQMSLAAQLPRLPMVKSISVVETEGTGRHSRIEWVSEQSAWRPERIAPQHLTIPADFRLLINGQPAHTAADSAQLKHWQTPPG